MPTLSIGNQSVEVGDAFLKMSPAEQNAAVEEIAGSIGVKSAPAPETTLAGIGKSALSGAVGGVADLAGLPADLLALAGAKGSEDFQKTYGSEAIRKGFAEKGFDFYKPQTGTEEWVQTTGSFLPGMIGGGGGLAAKFLTRAAIPAAGAELAGAAAEGTGYEPYAKVVGALGGAAVGPMAARLGARRLHLIRFHPSAWRHLMC